MTSSLHGTYAATDMYTENTCLLAETAEVDLVESGMGKM
jgi:hypothetical protein